MRTVVLVLNIASSLASLAIVLLGFWIGYVGLLGLEHGDYSAIILGVVLRKKRLLRTRTTTKDEDDLVAAAPCCGLLCER
jgi:hypothetical protein